jgi:hypothetical protein
VSALLRVEKDDIRSSQGVDAKVIKDIIVAGRVHPRVVNWEIVILFSILVKVCENNLSLGLASSFIVNLSKI